MGRVNSDGVGETHLYLYTNVSRVRGKPPGPRGPHRPGRTGQPTNRHMGAWDWGDGGPGRGAKGGVWEESGGDVG